MPIYEYKCINEHIEEVMVSSSDKVEICCPICGELSKKVSVYKVNIAFKSNDSSKNSIDIKIGRDAVEKKQHYAEKFKKKEDLIKRNPEAKIYFKDGMNYEAVNPDGTKDSTD